MNLGHLILATVAISAYAAQPDQSDDPVAAVLDSELEQELHSTKLGEETEGWCTGWSGPDKFDDGSKRVTSCKPDATKPCDPISKNKEACFKSCDDNVKCTNAIFESGTNSKPSVCFRGDNGIWTRLNGATLPARNACTSSPGCTTTCYRKPSTAVHEALGEAGWCRQFKGYRTIKGGVGGKFNRAGVAGRGKITKAECFDRCDNIEACTNAIFEEAPRANICFIGVNSNGHEKLGTIPARKKCKAQAQCQNTCYRKQIKRAATEYFGTESTTDGSD